MDVGVVLAGDSLRGYAAELARQLAEQGCDLIAADGGADRLAEWGLRPSLIVGDDDSLRGSFADVPRLPLQQRKNFTDGEAALSYALEHHTGRVWLLSSCGGRPDHQLANLLLPLHAGGLAASGPAWSDWPARRVWLAGDNWRACYAAAGDNRIEGQPGDIISLIPLQPVLGLSLSGLEYPLHDYDLVPGDSRTVSNLLTANWAQVSLRQGVLLIFHIFDHITSSDNN